jgi:gluconolactonase
MILDEVVRQLRPSQSEGTRVFSPDATPQIHQDVGAGEGPLWSDVLGLLTSGDGHIMRRTLDGQLLVHLKDAGSNGLAFDAEGRLLICQFKARQVSRLEKDGSLTILTDRFEGAQYNQPNDLTVDTQGRIYFSDPQYGPRDQMEMRDGEGRLVEGVYRIDLDGQVSRIISHEVDRPNGLAISADDRYLFVADNNNNTLRGARKLWRFELTPAGDIAPGSRELLFDWRQTRGPDGLELDEMGRIYVAAGINRDNAPYETQAHPTAGVYVFSPEGELLDFRAIPRDECTNVAFGGIDRKTLYVTAGGSLWSIPTLVPGKSIVQQ